MKPIIGVIMRPDKTGGENDIYCVYKDINHAIIKSGGITLGITPYQVEDFYGKDISNTQKMSDIEFMNMKMLIDKCDGIICQGGDDYYDYDVKVIEYCYEMDKPLLGICLGMQAMGCAFNGKMQDISNSNHQQKGINYVHKVAINEHSKLYEVLNTKEFLVNSRHKSQLIDTSLDIVGYSSDHIIEVIEDKNKTFFIGVQWHPETMYAYDTLAHTLFDHFIAVCRRK